MNAKKKHQPRTKGSTIVLVMIAVVIMLVLGTGLLALDFQVRNWATRTAAEIGSRTAADAGLTKAVLLMNDLLKAGSLYHAGTLPSADDECLPNCDATFDYTITGGLFTGYNIESVGHSGHFTRQVNANLKLRGIFDNAIYAQQIIILRNNILIDAPTAGIATDPNGDGTTASNSAEVNGAIKEEYWELPMMSPPAGPTFQSSRGSIQTDRTLTPADSGRYDQIRLKSKKLIVDAPGVNPTMQTVTLYVTGNVSFDTSSELEIGADTSLVLYLDGDFTVRNPSLMNVAIKQPKQLLIIECTDRRNFVIENSVQFYGVIYAPGAYINASNNVDIVGSIVAKKVLIDNHTELRYDESLAGGAFLNFPVKLVVDRWWQGEEW